MAKLQKFIQKARSSDRFVMVPNDTAQDHRLTWRARGLLTFLLSLPDDWIIHKTWLYRKEQTADGRQGTDGAFKELEKLGYIICRVIPATSSTPPQARYFVYSSPMPESQHPADDGEPTSGEPTSGEPTSGEPTSGEPATTNTQPTKETSTKETHTKAARDQNDFLTNDSQVQKVFEKVRATFPDYPASPQEATFKKFLKEGGGAEKCLTNLEAYDSYKRASGELVHSWRGFVDKAVIAQDWVNMPPRKRAKETGIDFLNKHWTNDSEAMTLKQPDDLKFSNEQESLFKQLAKLKNWIPAESESWRRYIMQKIDPGKVTLHLEHQLRNAKPSHQHDKNHRTPANAIIEPRPGGFGTL